MNRKSKFKIIIDFKKSKNSYIHDKRSKKSFLDFFGQYSSLAIGYNNEIFNNKDFLYEMKLVSKQKIVNNEIFSYETKEFDKIFQKFTSNNIFEFYHYCCTGALAVESAIKTAIDYKNTKNPIIASFKGSFHGINSYGGIISDRVGGVADRLKGFPGGYWKLYNNPIIKFKENKPTDSKVEINKTIFELEKDLINNKNIVCIIVEPIQCTNGDNYFEKSFFKKLRALATKYNVPLIFDEVQTGFFVTGKKWYYEHLDIVPDILIFGKKTQMSGIMVRKKFSKIFKKPIRLEVTWDGDAVDMIRCKYIIKALKKNNVIYNVNKMSELFKNGLNSINNIINIRNCGLLFAFDLKNNAQQKMIFKSMLKFGMLSNQTGKKTIRLRPNLLVTSEEINNALNIIELSAKKIK